MAPQLLNGGAGCVFVCNLSGQVKQNIKFYQEKRTLKRHNVLEKKMTFFI